MAVNLGTRGVQEACDLLEYCQPPRRHRAGPTCASPTAPRSRTASGCGAWATRWTARGRSATRPPTSTAGSPPRPPGRCAWSTRRSSWSPAAAPTAACRPSAPGRRRSSSTPTTTSTTSRCTPTTSEHDGDRGQLPGLRRRHGPLHRRRSSRPPTTCGAKRQHDKRINLSFDEWNVWYQAAVRRPSASRRLAARRPRADRGRLHRRRRRRRRQPADHAAAARRPGRRRLPGPAGQRHRADPDRARRPGLAADHLPPVRADRPATPGAPCCGRRRSRRATTPTKLRRRAAARRRRRARRGDRRADRLRGQPRPHRDAPAGRSTCAACRGCPAGVRASARRRRPARRPTPRPSPTG